MPKLKTSPGSAEPATVVLSNTEPGATTVNLNPGAIDATVAVGVEMGVRVVVVILGGTEHSRYFE
jgi:hypothetical protein